MALLTRKLLHHLRPFGIDVPAAGLYQAQAKEEGQRLGIRYVSVADILHAVEGRS